MTGYATPEPNGSLPGSAVDGGQRRALSPALSELSITWSGLGFCVARLHAAFLVMSWGTSVCSLEEGRGLGGWGAGGSGNHLQEWWVESPGGLWELPWTWMVSEAVREARGRQWGPPPVWAQVHL